MTDPRHLRLLLTRLFARMRHDYAASIRAWADVGAHGSAPSLARWLPVMQEAVKPILFPLWQRGARAGLRSIMAQLGTRRKAWRDQFANLQTDRMRKDLRRPQIDLSFDVFNTRILEALDRAVFDFCQSTLDTIRGDVETWRDRLRKDMGEGLELGESARMLTAGVQRIFADPARAQRIAQTEISHAVHGGQFLLDKESGIVSTKTWLASSDACPLCLSLAAKGPIPLDEPFHIHKKPGPYQVVMYPGAHPGCFCTYTSGVDYEALEPRRQAPYGMGGLAVRERLAGLEADL